MFGIVKQLKRIADELHDQNLHTDRLEDLYRENNRRTLQDSAWNKAYISWAMGIKNKEDKPKQEHP